MSVHIEQEWPGIRAAALGHGVDPFLVLAIRLQENGEPGGDWGEFGLPADRYPDYTTQLAGCCKTVRSALVEYDGNPYTLTITSAGYRRVVPKAAFLTALRDRYAPLRAANDPHGVNANWFPGVMKFYSEHAVQNLGKLPL